MALHSATEIVSVIVRARSGATGAAEHAVESAGGQVGRRIDIIDGFAAGVPADSLDQIRRDPAVHSVTANRTVRLLHATEGFDPASDDGSIYNATKSIKAHDVWRTGYTGAGVDVALIDSGVVPVNGLAAPGKIINGP